MFTGIVEETGRVVAVEALAGGRRITVACSFAAELRVDESVAIDGACMTVVRQSQDDFDVVTVEESLAKTNLGRLGAGDRVNLERALRLGARLDGHLVQGHVDATGTVESVEALADSRLIRIRHPERFAPYLIPVGSITVDGVSLTVARLDAGAFTVSIIPHTWEKTTADEWRPGRAVNLEFDLIGKYVVRALEHGVSPDRLRAPGA